MSSNYEHGGRLLSEAFIAPPHLRSLEATGRMVLLAAARQYRQYGTDSDWLLQSYSEGTWVSADFTRFYMNEQDPSYSSVVINLSRHTLSITLNQGHKDELHTVAAPVSHTALITPVRSAIYGRGRNKPFIHNTTQPDALQEFTNELDHEVELLELVLDRDLLQELQA